MDIYKKIIEKYGEANQMQKACEELAELIQVVSRWLIADRDTPAEVLDNVSEEMADVEIMLAQLKIIFNNRVEVELWKEYKLGRMVERLG